MIRQYDWPGTADQGLRGEDAAPSQLDPSADRDWYFDLYDRAPVGYLVLDEDGLILEANLTAANLLGKPKRALTRQPFDRFVLPGDSHIHREHFKRLLDSGAPHAWEIRLRGKSAVPFCVLLEATVGEDGISRIVMSDIADRKRNQQTELTDLRSELHARQRLEGVGALASGIAHDFNNLLGTVLAQAELALSDLADGLHPEEELKTIRAEAIRGSEIGRQLMIYARKENEVLEQVDLSKMIAEMLELLKISVSKHAILETDLGQNLPAVTANPAQLRRVIMNLVINASDSLRDQDGVIRVMTKRLILNRNSTSSYSKRLPEGGYVQIRVSDTGCGMTPETQAQAFEPFFTTKSQGHGLGLPVVHEIVQSLHGAILLESTPGNGTSFEILLPCCAGNQPGPTHGASASSSGEKACAQTAGTILIVEDEEFLRQPVSKMIRRTGYSVLEAGDGSAAVDWIHTFENDIDVMVLDVTLPGRSSREVFEEARRLRPDMSIVVSSAYSEEVAALSLGHEVDHFIRKPYRLDRLLTLIGQLQSAKATR